MKHWAAGLALASSSMAQAQLISVRLNYPPAELIARAAGVVGYEVDLAPSGKVKTCRVVTTSGYPGLDAATCEQLRKTGRFKPAHDAAGKATPSIYSGKLRWALAAPPAPAK